MLKKTNNNVDEFGFSSSREIRKIFKKLSYYNVGTNLHQEISKIKVIDRVNTYEIFFNLNNRKKKFPLYVKLASSFKNGNDDKEYTNSFAKGKLVSKNHVISKTMFNNTHHNSSKLSAYYYHEETNAYLFNIGIEVFAISFNDSFVKNREEVKLILDIINKSLISNTLSNAFIDQMSLCFVEISREDSDIPSKEIGFEHILEGHAYLLHTSFGFNKIIFEASADAQILFGDKKGYVVDYQDKENILSGGSYLEKGSVVNKEKFDEVIVLPFDHKNQITIYLGSPNYSKYYVRETLKLNNFMISLKVIFKNFFYYSINKKKFIQKESILRRSSELDHLTRLLNRAGFYRLIREKILANRINTLIEIDIDNFKIINDTYGHDAGDEVLKHISSLMSEHFPRSAIFSRFGGEEFYILIPNKEISAGAFALESFRQAVENTPCLYKNESKVTNIKVTISSGITTFLFSKKKEDIMDGLKKQMKNVDRALYRAKKFGKNCIYCYSNGEIFRYMPVNSGMI